MKRSEVRVDPADSVHCYCPISSSNQTLLTSAGVKALATSKKAWGQALSFFRCLAHAPLTVRGEATSGFKGEEAIWPEGCGRVYSERIVSDPVQCAPERFLFSYVEGELPEDGYDLLHIHGQNALKVIRAVHYGKAKCLKVLDCLSPAVIGTSSHECTH